jgi:hypothetical protein
MRIVDSEVLVALDGTSLERPLKIGAEEGRAAHSAIEGGE